MFITLRCSNKIRCSSHEGSIMVDACMSSLSDQDQIRVFKSSHPPKAAGLSALLECGRLITQIVRSNDSRFRLTQARCDIGAFRNHRAITECPSRNLIVNLHEDQCKSLPLGNSATSIELAVTGCIVDDNGGTS